MESTPYVFETVVPTFPADKVSLTHEALAAYRVLRGR